MKKQTSFIIGLVLALIVVVFAVLNVEPTVINFGFAKVKLPLIIILILALIVGALIALLLSTTGSISRKREQKQLSQELNVLKQNQQASIDQAVADAQERSRQELLEKEQALAALEAQLADLQAANGVAGGSNDTTLK
ncbi:LapA family protein [Lapidilactobacillus luobeiensis]|uniref:LapA family protein n=1 Tax=Lapidilactobacillus luobeiensis TaxID=2950371 RepID=UPI0021C2FA37|nr:lipopolysaccharide assembly protein LapA domain-containing protein [Lapidilactobacillus luobeiensis]